MGLQTFLAADTRLLDLDQAINLALSHSLDLQANRASLATQQQAHDFKIRSFLPNVSLDFFSTNSMVVDGVDSRMYKIGGQVSQLVFDGGRFLRQDQMSQLERQTSLCALGKAESDLGDQVRTLVRQIEVQVRSQAIQIQTLGLAKEQSQIARKEFELGLSIELDAITAELSWKSLEVQIGQTNMDLEQGQQKLKQFLGFNMADEVRVQLDFDPEYTGQNLDDRHNLLAEQALRDNQNLVQQDLAIHQSRLKLCDAQWSFLPNISLEASLSFSGNRLPLQQAEWAARLVFELPLPGLVLKPGLSLGGSPGLKQEGGLSASAGVAENLEQVISLPSLSQALELAVEKRLRAEPELRFALESLLSDYRLKVRQLALNRDLITTAAKRNQIMARQLELGEIRRIEYLQAETKLAQDRIEVIKAVAGLLDAERAIEKLAGMSAGSLAAMVGTKSAKGD